MAGDQLCLAAAILPHTQVPHRPTTGMALSSDHKAEPEPDVATEHEEADEEDQVDGLVVGGCAGLLNLDQGGVVDAMVGVDCLLCLARWGTSCCQLLGLEAENSLPGPNIDFLKKDSNYRVFVYFAMIVKPADPRHATTLPVEHVVLKS